VRVPRFALPPLISSSTRPEGAPGIGKRKRPVRSGSVSKDPTSRVTPCSGRPSSRSTWRVIAVTPAGACSGGSVCYWISASRSAPRLTTGGSPSRQTSARCRFALCAGARARFLRSAAQGAIDAVLLQ
jgi:hypothetical protein